MPATSPLPDNKIHQLATLNTTHCEAPQKLVGHFDFTRLWDQYLEDLASWKKCYSLHEALVNDIESRETP